MAPALAVELRNTLDRLIQQSQAQQAAAPAPKPGTASTGEKRSGNSGSPPGSLRSDQLNAENDG